MDDDKNACAAQIRRRLMERYFAGPIIENSFRGAYVEEMVALALEPEWRHCSVGWAGWDLDNPGNGLRIEVKQSALKQIWTGPEKMGSYSIEEADGYFEGSVWHKLAQPKRLAQIYVFAFHPIVDATADHTDPGQWEFRVVPAVALPERQKTISVSVVRQKWGASRYQQLRAAVMNASEQLS